ncbi:MAG: helix-hairpin-helix domain-containing protein [Planctomycetota bacterium]
MKPIYTTSEKVILGLLILLLFCVSTVVIFSKTSKIPALFSHERNFYLIDINTASFKELCLIPYISHNIAYEIIKYRQEKRGINNMDELLSIKGIGRAKLKMIKGYLKAMPK